MNIVYHVITSDCDFNGMSIEPNLTDQDYELLSAYIDGELPAAQQTALEARLEQDSTLRRELNGLRQTVALINQLPTLKAPRDFTLDATQTRSPEMRPLPMRKTIRPFYRRPSLWSAAAAIMLFIVGGVFVLSVLGPSIGNIYSDITHSLAVGDSDTQQGFNPGQVASVPTAQATGEPAAASGNLAPNSTPEELHTEIDTTSARLTLTLTVVEGETNIALEESPELQYAVPPAAPAQTEVAREQGDNRDAAVDSFMTEATLADGVLAQVNTQPAPDDQTNDLYNAPQMTAPSSTGAAGSALIAQPTAETAEKINATSTQVALAATNALIGGTNQQAQRPGTAEPLPSTADETNASPVVSGEDRGRLDLTATALNLALAPTATAPAPGASIQPPQPSEQTESVPPVDNTLVFLVILVLGVLGVAIIIQRRNK